MEIDRVILKKAAVFLFITAVTFLFLAMPSFAAPESATTSAIKAANAPASTLAVDNKPADPAVIDDDEDEDTMAVSPGDPYEKFNRAMFNVNEGLDKYVLKPVASFYNLIMPRPLNEGIHNFFVNIDTVPTIANDILQFNFYQAANDIWRVGVNTTVGIGGLFDVASRIKLMPYKNDFGMTLAKWGYAQSSYIVLPFWGPRTIRDTISLPVDYYAFSVYPRIRSEKLRYGLYALSVVDWRAQVLKHQDLFDTAAVDKYAFMRNAYIQYRSNAIKNNEHRSYLDQKEDQTPVAEIDSTNIQASDDEPTFDMAE